MVSHGPGSQPLAATDAERERMEAALREGWMIRLDLVRLEYTAARELIAARTLGQLLDEIEAHGG